MNTTDPAAPRLPWDAADPYPYYETQRRKGTVVWDEAAGAYLILGHGAARQVLGDADWCNPLAAPAVQAMMDPVGRELVNRNMLFAHDRDHARLRASVHDVFVPGFISGLTDGVSAIAADALQNCPAGTPFNYVEDIALPLPIAVAAAWMALDVPSSRLLRQHSPAISGMLGAFADMETVTTGSGAFATLMTEFLAIVADRRKNPGDDLISFMSADPDLTLDDVVINAILIAVAGHETTANLLGSAMVRLLSPQADGSRLVDTVDTSDPALVNELLRLDGSVHATARTALTDHVVDGIEIATGTTVFVVLAAANRDPDVFVEPDELRLDRRDAAPLTFGFGAHYCLGGALARLEISAALSETLARDPELAGPARWRNTQAVRGPLSVPLIFRS
ncbi:cytochrome P450 [Mycolicibacterium farcinogenes]|uniref:cytochrome P450 n=1 Tax=Mycolicibacterium farcinogenes TaxID=1802 RepID=UPI001C8EBEFE|nr:cytochrome P450 [Mycolicibacterium farcinogenes]QZH59724.1 cytochrome P450 [Mycolicibacterium farcinogenes]